jgi:membrane AbrB-like protein
MAITLLIGISGAVVGVYAGLPLPYMLGPLLFAAIAALAGAPMMIIPYGRELGQVVVGLSIGLRFTPAVALTTATLLPAMVLSTGFIMLATIGAAFLMQRLGRVDSRTAFFSTAAAGVIEMSVIAMQKGADSSVVAITHLVRVTLIVATIPFLVTMFGAHGQVQPVDIPFDSEALPLMGLLLAAAVLSYFAAPLRIPNTWLLVPVILGALFAVFGFGPFAVPRLLLIVAQIVIGTWVGSRFRRDIVGRLPRVTITAVIVTAYLIAAAFLLAWLLTCITDLSFTTAVLAVAPAGVTEMVLTATAMHLDAATVTAFQIMRIAVVMTTIQFTFAAFVALTNRLSPEPLTTPEQN